jgi:hypothetical protein
MRSLIINQALTPLLAEIMKDHPRLDKPSYSMKEVESMQ